MEKRRSRAKSASTGKKVSPQPRDLLTFQLLDEHGPLSNVYLYQLTKHLAVSEKRQKDRMTDLFHEENTKHGGRYVNRPYQLNPPKDFYRQVVSENTPRARQALAEAGTSVRGSDHVVRQYDHLFMVSCITASFQLAVQAYPNLRYVSRAEIMSRATNKTLAIPCAISHRFPSGVEFYDNVLVPDGLFGIEYDTAGEKTYLFFLLEADRHKEPVRRQGFTTTSYLRKTLQYREVVGRGLYKHHFGMKAGMLVLNVTTNREHEHEIRTMVEQVVGKNPYMLFATVEHFEGYLDVPPVLYDLFEKGWRRVGYADYLIPR